MTLAQVATRPAPAVGRLAAAALAMTLGVGLPAARAAAQGAPLPPLKKDADRLEQKLEQIRVLGAEPQLASSRAARTRETTLTEPEVNAYLWWHLDELVPAGVTDPKLRLGDNGQVDASAVVDLSAIRQQRERGWLDPLAYVGGRVTVTAAGILHTAAGLATLDVKSVTVAGVSVPTSVLQDLVGYYTRSPQAPQGVNLADPLPLPSAIREIAISKGQATIVQ
jgi:hypothetical protein